MVQNGSRPTNRPPLGDDRELAPLLAVCSTDRSALELLYELTHRRVFGLCMAIVADEEAAEEVTVDVYSQVWRRSESFDPLRGSVLTWILTIARTRAIDFTRARRRRTARLTSVESGADVAGSSPDPEAACMGEESARLVRDLVAKLPDGQRAAIETAYFRGLSYAETAEALAQPIGTIKTRIRAALTTLRQAFRDIEREFP